MSNVQPSLFPVIEDVTTLWRALVNDTFTGVSGVAGSGRIATDDAPFTLPFLNSAINKVLRDLRNEGVTFPIKDGIVLNAVPPVVQSDPSVFVNIGYTGTNNGTTTSASPALPGDCMQVYTVRQRQTGSNLQFTPMRQAQEGLVSSYQNNWLGMWEWRQYAIWLNGSLVPQDLMIRYQSGQPPIRVAASAFSSTPIFILDCVDALANLMAGMYGRARGANPVSIKSVEDAAEGYISAMAEEYIRRQQTVTYQRQSYQGGGSNEGTFTDLGATGTVQ